MPGLSRQVRRHPGAPRGGALGCPGTSWKHSKFQGGGLRPSWSLGWLGLRAVTLTVTSKPRLCPPTPGVGGGAGQGTWPERLEAYRWQPGLGSVGQQWGLGGLGVQQVSGSGSLGSWEQIHLRFPGQEWPPRFLWTSPDSHHLGLGCPRPSPVNRSPQSVQIYGRRDEAPVSPRGPARPQRGKCM